VFGKCSFHKWLFNTISALVDHSRIGLTWWLRTKPCLRWPALSLLRRCNAFAPIFRWFSVPATAKRLLRKELRLRAFASLSTNRWSLTALLRRSGKWWTINKTLEHEIIIKIYMLSLDTCNEIKLSVAWFFLWYHNTISQPELTFWVLLFILSFELGSEVVISFSKKGKSIWQGLPFWFLRQTLSSVHS